MVNAAPHTVAIAGQRMEKMGKAGELRAAIKRRLRGVFTQVYRKSRPLPVPTWSAGRQTCMDGECVRGKRVPDCVLEIEEVRKG
jgi:hypothetical protein